MPNLSLAVIRSRLCGRRSFSPAMLVLIGPVAIVVGLIQIVGLESLSFADRAGITVVNACVIICLFFLYAHLHKSAGYPSLPLWVVLAGYASLGAIRALIPMAGSWLGLLPPLQNPGLRFVQSVVTTMIVLSMCAVALDLLDQRRKAVEKLRQQVRSLEDLRATTREHLAQTKAQATDLVQSEIEPVLDEIDAAAMECLDDPDTANLAELAALLRERSQTTVRPLSHQLYAQQAFEPAAPAEIRQTWQARAADLARTTVSETGFLPGITAVLFVISFYGPSTSAVGSARAAASVVVGGIVCFLLTSISNRFVTSKAREWSLPASVAVWLCVLVIVSVLTGMTTVGLELGGIDGFEFASAAAVVAIYAVVVSVVAGAGRQIDRTRQDLEVTVTAYQQELDALRSADDAIRQRIGGLVHGSIQATMVANALRLDLATRAQDNSSPDAMRVAVEELRVDIAAIQSEVAVAAGTQSAWNGLAPGIAAVAERWCDIVDVRLPAELPAIEDHTAQRIPELLQEAIVNAVKHGSATEVELALIMQPQAVILTVTDNGSGSRKSDIQGAGLGAALGDASAELTRDKLGQHLIIHIPCAARDGQ